MVKGSLFFGIVAISVASVLAGCFSGQFNFMICLLTLIVCCFLYAIYFLARNFIYQDCKKYFCYCLLAVAGVVMLEMLISGFMTGNLITAIANKRLRVGIDEINAAATLLGCSIPLCFYLAFESKVKCVWFALATLLLIFVAISCSRGALLFSLVICIATLVFYYIKVLGKYILFYLNLG